MGLAALVMLWRDDPNFPGNLGCDFLHHRHARGVDAVVVGQDYAVEHG
jgi:hypothetical protein